MNLPKRNGESFLDPPFRDWIYLLKRNRQLLTSYRFLICGVSFPEIRKGVRERLSSLKISPDDPLLLTGHQPHFVHPGIWFRFFLLDRAREELGVNSAAFILDSDLNRVLTVPVPREWEGELLLQEIPFPLESGVFEFLSSPLKEDWEKFLRNIEDCFNFPEAVFARENFSKIRNFTWKRENFSNFCSRLRRFYEGKPEYPEFPLSEILKEEFRLFFLHIAENAESFALAYNASNARWRKEKRSRSKDMPFPDLKISQGEIELPFWIVDQGERFPLFLDSKGILKSGEKAWGRLKGAVTDWKIRPRAATLTMFLRLFACDLFLHGLGGGEYEEAVDFLIQEFFGVEPPAFARASLTLFFPGFDSEELQQLKERVREMKKNPEKFLSARLARQFQDLILQKVKLTQEKLNKEKYQELQNLNSQLLSFLERELQELQAEIQRREERGKILSFRQYPFFFFRSDEIQRLARQA